MFPMPAGLTERRGSGQLDESALAEYVLTVTDVGAMETTFTLQKEHPSLV